jgi:alcohol dehydrogenase
MCTPTENVYPLPHGATSEPARWAAGLGVHLIPFGGLRAARLEAGETLLVSGATGNLGSSAVAVGLALGAGRIVAAGRNRKLLDPLRERFGERVRPVGLTGDAQQDPRAIAQAADAPIDVVIDLLPPEANSSSARTAAMTVREFGRVVLMGGVGMLGGDDLALPYPWVMRNSVTVLGQWMYPRAANDAVIRLLDSGQLNLSGKTVTTFPLEQVHEAVAFAAEHPRSFHRTFVTMT